MIGVFTEGLWDLRREIATVTGLRPVRRSFSTRGLDAVAAWGRKSAARYARLLARMGGAPVITLEDGFLRSVRPGGAERSASYVADRLGIYFDTRRPNALEAMIRARAADPVRAAQDAAPALAALRELGLSKYNDFDPVAGRRFLDDPRMEGAVLLVDQTRGDAALTGAGAGARAFAAMLACAARENPGLLLLLKVHPETLTGRRAGHFTPAMIRRMARLCPEVAEARRRGLIALLTDRLAPHALFQRVGRVYAVSSLLGFEALVAGAPTTVFGRSFYAGWGLTDDRAPPIPQRGAVPLAAVAAAAFCDYTRYLHPVTREPWSLPEAVADLVARRERNAQPGDGAPGRVGQG